MKTILVAAFLAIASVSTYSHASPRTVETRTPVYESVYQPGAYTCYEAGPRANVGGAIIGGVVGYAIGRELDRGGRRFHGPVYGPRYGHGPVPHHGHRDSRLGRYSGSVAGAYIGSQVGRHPNTVCTDSPGRYQRVLRGYKVLVRYPDGSVHEYFESVF